MLAGEYAPEQQSRGLSADDSEEEIRGIQRYDAVMGAFTEAQMSKSARSRYERKRRQANTREAYKAVVGALRATESGVAVLEEGGVRLPSAAEVSRAIREQQDLNDVASYLRSGILPEDDARRRVTLDRAEDHILKGDLLFRVWWRTQDQSL